MAGPAASTVAIDETARTRLRVLARSRTAPHQQVLRAGIVLAAAEGTPNAVIARELSISQDTVRTWRDRFAAEGTAGLADRQRQGRLYYGT